jgi:hypothetical protein
MIGNTTIEGSDITAGWLTLDSDKVLITAGIDQYKNETSSSTKSVTASGGSNGSASASASTSSSQSSSTSLQNVNSRINVGHLESDADSFTLRGAEVTANTADLNVGSLTVQSLQDTSSSSNSSKSTSVGVSNSTSSNGSSQSVNVGVNRSNGSSEAQEVGNQTQLLITDGAKSQITAKDTTLIGGLIANATKNEDGTLTDLGKLNLTTGTLTVSDLEDKSKSEQSSMGLQASSGTTTVSMSKQGHKTEGETQATLGQGNIQVGGASLSDQEQYADLNRNVNEGQITTLDQQTAGLNASASMDNRWLTEEGRNSLKNDQKKAAAEVVTGVAQVGAAVTAAVSDTGQIGNAWAMVGKGQDLAYADDGKTAAKIEAVRDGEVQAGETAQGIAGELVGTLNPDGTSQVRVTEGMNAYGAYNENTNTIYLEVSAETRGSIVNTAAHEVMHAQGANETTSTVTGYMTDLAYQVNAWANSDQIDNARSQMVFAPANAAADKELLDKNNVAFTGDAERGELEYRVLPKKEKEQAKDIADKSGQYSVEQIEELAWGSPPCVGGLGLIRP